MSVRDRLQRELGLGECMRLTVGWAVNLRSVDLASPHDLPRYFVTPPLVNLKRCFIRLTRSRRFSQVPPALLLVGSCRRSMGRVPAPGRARRLDIKPKSGRLQPLVRAHVLGLSDRAHPPRPHPHRHRHQLVHPQPRHPRHLRPRRLALELGPPRWLWRDGRGEEAGVGGE